MFSRRELAFAGLALACLAGQMLIYRGPESGQVARVVTVLLGLGVFGFCLAMAVSIRRRAFAQAKDPE